MTTRMKPRTGSPVLCYKTRRVLAHWRDNAPAMDSSCARWEFAAPLSVAAAWGAISRADLEEVCISSIYVQRVFGSAEDEVQVWATDAAPDVLHRLGFFTVTAETDLEKDAEALRRVLGMRQVRIVDHYSRHMMEDLARYIEEEVRYRRTRS